MKIKRILLLLLMIVLLISCKENDNVSRNYSFTGKAQKGPFITGTTITLNELNPSLGQTGRSFTTSISSDDGSFSMNNIELNSNFTLLIANGFYFSEIYGKLSEAPLSLQAIANLSGKESVNINVFTHLIKGRIETLVASGMTISMARDQAKSEFLSFLGVTESMGLDFESLDISNSDEANGILLAFSIILQRHAFGNERLASTAELTQLLSALSTDFAPDGEINDKTIMDKLLYNVSQLNLIDIRNNVQKRYADLGQSVTVPNFEKYIAKFQEKYMENLTTNFTYPKTSSPDPIMDPNSKLPNLLFPTDTVFKANMPFTIAATIPLYSTLTIKIIGNSSGNFGGGGPIYGWEWTYDHDIPNVITLNSQRQNELMTVLFYLLSPGSATMEYYENSSTTPTFTKRIRWQ